jgi:hypothetical protein
MHRSTLGWDEALQKRLHGERFGEKPFSRVAQGDRARAHEARCFNAVILSGRRTDECTAMSW